MFFQSRGAVRVHETSVDRHETRQDLAAAELLGSIEDGAADTEGELVVLALKTQCERFQVKKNRGPTVSDAWLGCVASS